LTVDQIIQRILIGSELGLQSQFDLE